jgi:8-hydroxy-5-deazaflavin:NADPH oxidoreductase
MTTIAVIGTGNMGKGIAGSFAKASYQVFLGSRNRETAKEVAAQIGQSRITGVSNLEAVKRANIVFLAIPYQENNETINELKTALKGKIVVDISNPLNATYDGLTTEPDHSAAESVAAHLPESRVVGAFKNTLAGVFYEPYFDGDQKSTVLVIGDDEKAKAEVIELINELPFQALDAGSLQKARTIEQLTVLILGLSMKHNYNWHAGIRVVS